MTSSREGDSREKLSKLRGKWMVTGGEGRGSAEIGCPEL